MLHFQSAFSLSFLTSSRDFLVLYCLPHNYKIYCSSFLFLCTLYFLPLNILDSQICFSRNAFHHCLYIRESRGLSWNSSCRHLLCPSWAEQPASPIDCAHLEPTSFHPNHTRVPRVSEFLLESHWVFSSWIWVILVLLMCKMYSETLEVAKECVMVRRGNCRQQECRQGLSLQVGASQKCTWDLFQDWKKKGKLFLS